MRCYKALFWRNVNKITHGVELVKEQVPFRRRARHMQGIYISQLSVGYLVKKIPNSHSHLFGLWWAIDRLVYVIRVAVSGVVESFYVTTLTKEEIPFDS